MHSTALRSLLSSAALLGVVAAATAQVPDGYVVFASFKGANANYGLFFAHPRDTAAPWIPVTGLSSALAPSTATTSGASSVLRRSSDGALIVGERAPAGTSVDVHVLRLVGAHVTKALLFSCGTSFAQGEIPQCGLLPDERIVVSATDLTAGGPLAHFDNGAGYHWQGLAILDPKSGGFTAIPVSNWSALTGVINGLAVSRDGTTVYIGEYIGVAAGALWQVPTAGGALTLCSALPFGASNVAIDQDDTVLVTTLNGPPNLFRYDPASLVTTPMALGIGPMNAVAVEAATGNYLLATANAGMPPRSLYWTTPTGTPNLLLNPNLATISGLDSNPNPESYGQSSGGTTTYRWLVAPNPGGLPEQGNAAFSITCAADAPMIAAGFFLFAFAPIPPTDVFGLTVHIDLTAFFSVPTVMIDTAVFGWSIPVDPTLLGDAFFAQAVFIEPSSVLAATPGLSFTVL